MNKLYLLAPLLLLLHFCNAQNYHKVRKVVPLLQEQNFYLNGGIRSEFGGKSRTMLQITLPANTVEWYYTFSTTEGQSANQPSLKLTAQLTRLIDPSGATSLLASAILTPTGSRVCDIYLMDYQNMTGFINKVDNTGGHLRSVASAMRLNYREGTVQVKDAISGTYYLCFKNPSASAGLAISVEAAAIIEEVVTDSVDSQPVIQQQASDEAGKAANYVTLGRKAFLNGDIDRCISLNQRALNLDSTMAEAKTNIALCYLVKGKEETASDLYIDAIELMKHARSKELTRQYFRVAIDDLKNARQKFPSLKGANDIQSLLEEELKKQ